MFTLLHEVHFWTQKDALFIKDTDFGSFMYYDKKQVSQSLFWEGKKSYMEKRGILWSPSNKRPKRLKDALKELEELLNVHRVVTCQWRSPVHVQIILGTGLKISIKINCNTGDIEEIYIDKYMVGKLCSQYISDVCLSEDHAVFAYTENQVTLIQFTKPSTKFIDDKKWSSLEPKVQTADLCGPSGRKVDKKICFNSLGDMILVWWKCGRDEVYPWSPSVKDEERANLHIYSIQMLKLDLISFYRTEFDPVLITFSLNKSNVVHVVQQKISHLGEVRLEWWTLELVRGRLETSHQVSLPLPTHSCVTVLSPREDRLFVGCIDGSVLIAHLFSTPSYTAKAPFIPSLGLWHPDSSLVLVSNDRGQMQWFDRALNPVRSQTTSELSTPSNIMDIGSHFRYQPTLLNFSWGRSPLTSEENPRGADDVLLIRFERGPVGAVRLVRGCALPPPALVFIYLRHNAPEAALSVLLSLDWSSDGEWALSSLQAILSHLLPLPLTPQTEDYLERALGSYHKPKRKVPDSVDMEFGGSVHDLSRKFFHHLLRYQVYEKAFRLAIDLDDYDLFMDVHNYAKDTGNLALAAEALRRAELVPYSDSSSSDESCDCSCSSEASEPPRRRLSPPPLPLLPPPPRHKVTFANTVTRIGVPSTSQEGVTPFLTEEEMSPNLVGVDYPQFQSSLPYSPPPSLVLPHLKPISLTNSNIGANFETRLSPRNRSMANLEDVESGKIKVVHFGLV